MALTLGVKVGSVIYLNDTPMKIVGIRSDYVMVECNGGFHVVDNDKFSEVLPDVRVTVERIGWEDEDLKQYDMARIVIDAPNEIKILRQELYERGNKKTVPDGTESVGAVQATGG